jgi:hypothetical protein
LAVGRSQFAIPGLLTENLAWMGFGGLWQVSQTSRRRDFADFQKQRSPGVGYPYEMGTPHYL